MPNGRKRRGLAAHSLSLVAALFFLAGPAASAAESGSSTYRLASGDRISVTVFGQPQMSGDVVVDGDGNIVVPLLDPVPVKGLTIQEAQKAIRQRLADGILQQPAVSIRIQELRPVYVLGDVRRPGMYPFRFGMSVQEAVALAGGYGIAETERGGALADYLVADERVQRLLFQKQALRTRAARLAAEVAGMDHFTPPTQDGTSPLNEKFAPALARTVVSEQDLFTTHVSLLRQQIELLRSQKPRLQGEIDALHQQIKAANSQLEMVKQQVGSYGRLMKQGLGTSTADFQLRITQSTEEGALWRLTADVSRLQREAGELDIKIADVDAAFKQRASTELRDVKQQLSEIELSLPAATAVRDVRLRYVGNYTQTGLKRSIQVTRLHDAKVKKVEATETTFLEPGDTVEIERPRPPLGTLGLDHFGARLESNGGSAEPSTTVGAARSASAAH